MSRVFCVGDLNVDLFTYSNEKPVFGEEKNVPLINYSLGGNAANFAVALSSLGEEVFLVSVLGHDVFTNFLKKELAKAKVKSLLINSKSLNGVSNIFVGKKGERGILSIKNCLDELDCKTVSKKILPKLKKGDVVYFGGFFHLLKMRNGFVTLLQKIHKKNCLIAFDATFDEYGKWEVKSFLKYIDLFFVNEKELEKICKTKNCSKAITKLFSWGGKEVIVKKGAMGAEYFSSKMNISINALKKKVINSTGAGDFFNAGYLFGLINKYTVVTCLRIGVFVASKRIEQKEFFTPSKKQVNVYLKKLS